ncbi:MAG: haloacid dehalogenase, partial [Thermoleophilaceae bacterium]|nr:haloacid dehalogenase [Thermoleophilaceae bacterium]
MPLPKDVKFVTFDCYCTVIDWETGAYDAYQKEADRDGFTLDRDTMIPLFLNTQREIQHGS